MSPLNLSTLVWRNCFGPYQFSISEHSAVFIMKRQDPHMFLILAVLHTLRAVQVFCK